jgi:hypothetical protein
MKKVYKNYSKYIYYQDGFPIHKLDGIIKYEKNQKEIQRIEIIGVKDSFIIKNVLTENECNSLIEETEQLEYLEAGVSTNRGS